MSQSASKPTISSAERAVLSSMVEHCYQDRDWSRLLTVDELSNFSYFTREQVQQALAGLRHLNLVKLGYDASGEFWCVNLDAARARLALLTVPSTKSTRQRPSSLAEGTDLS